MDACVFCLGTGVLRDDQVLLRGTNLYLCAPQGQLVEGYLAIAPYDCIGCLADLPSTYFDELAQLVALVTNFYAAAYGVHSATFYEQGRAGGGTVARQFPFHAHLCGLPLAVPLHTALASRHRSLPVPALRQLSQVAAGSPYAYVDSAGARRVYLPDSQGERLAMAALRLKPEIAALIGLPGRGHWRDHPGHAELASVVAHFRSFLASRSPEPLTGPDEA